MGRPPSRWAWKKRFLIAPSRFFRHSINVRLNGAASAPHSKPPCMERHPRGLLGTARNSTVRSRSLDYQAECRLLDGLPYVSLGASPTTGRDPPDSASSPKTAYMPERYTVLAPGEYVFNMIGRESSPGVVAIFNITARGARLETTMLALPGIPRGCGR